MFFGQETNLLLTRLYLESYVQSRIFLSAKNQ